MKQGITTFLLAILAGLSIALGGAVYLSVDSKMIGALCFTIGLFTICSMSLNLYTGKVCYIFERDKRYAADIPVIWLGNLVGTWGTAQLLLLTRIGEGIQERAMALCDAKLSDTLMSIFVLAIFCNVMIFIAVDGYANIPYETGKYLALFFGVVVFILSGYEHCIANMFYFSVADAWSMRTLLYLLVMTMGNALGGVLIPLARRLITKIAHS